MSNEQSPDKSDVAISILGAQDLPLVEVTLQPGSFVLSEQGRMISLPEGVKYTAVMGDGTEAGMFGKLKTGVSRMFSGESMILDRYHNETDGSKLVRFGTVVPGNLVHLKLPEYNEEVICANGAFLIGSFGTKVQSCFRQSLGAAFFGGAGFILQKVTGHGQVILQGGGTVLCEELTPERPRVRVDTGCLLAFTGNLDYNIAAAGGLKSMIFGGEGLFHASITLKQGQTRGQVWIQSFPYSKFIEIIKSNYAH